MRSIVQRSSDTWTLIATGGASVGDFSAAAGDGVIFELTRITTRFGTDCWSPI
jgi:glutamate carboxypeptidase